VGLPANAENKPLNSVLVGWEKVLTLEVQLAQNSPYGTSRET